MTVDVLAAEWFARDSHGSQMWGDYPYIVHLERVVYETRMWSKQFGMKKEPEVMLAAAFLHDTVEDTTATREDITRLFGDKVADLVWRLTDEPGNTRAEKKAKTYPKIKASKEATLIKMCDRLVNIQHSVDEESEKYLSIYKAEHNEFAAALYRKEFETLWVEMRTLLGISTKVTF